MTPSIFTVSFSVILFHVVKCDYPTVEEIGSKEFIGDHANVGFTAAFGDVNSDKQTDVFVISDSGKEVFVFLGSSKTPLLDLQQTLTLDVKGKSLVPADFNGDDVTDIMITYNNDDNSNSIFIYWGGDDGNFGTNISYKSPEKYIDEPLVLDANADMIADLFVVFPNNTRAFLIGQEVEDNWEFIVKPFKTKESMKLNDTYFPHSNAFIDLTGEGSADLFVTSKKDDKPFYEIWKGSSSGLILAKTISTEQNFSDSVGPIAFTDFDADGKQDLIVATCLRSGKNCIDGRILLYSKDEWHLIHSLNNEKWKFPSDGTGLSHQYNTLHIGDFNLDSYPDVLTIMEDEHGVRKAVVLYNDVCGTSDCAEVGRRLGQLFEMPNSNNAVLAAYYDFSMDGTLDVIVTSKSDEKYMMKAYKNMIADDVTFLRVQVLSGHVEKAVYGVNVPGPQMVYQTTNTMGGAQWGSLGQLSQSAHQSLQLPYVIFGLGRLANFVDSLTVSIPVPLIVYDEVSATTGSKVKRSNKTSTDDPFSPLNYTWPMLIPNSQLYVIPYPQETPSSWKNRLLVTPSQNVITTAMVLLATCGVLVIATFVLHWLERREDKKEKIQEAYRFHFDAM